MTQMSPEQVMQHRIEKLGEEGGRYFRNLENQLYFARDNWKCYVGLFGTNNDRVDLMNSLSGGTAFLIERAMKDSALLSICRMTDPECGKKKGKCEINTTIKRLTGYQKNGDKEGLEKLIKDAVDKSNFARVYRNKVLSHSDEETQNKKARLDTGSRKMIRESFDSIASCIKRFAEEEMSITLITHPLRNADDEVNLLQALFVGRGENERREAELRDIRVNKGWQAAKDLYPLPDWLTHRAEREFDV